MLRGFSSVCDFQVGFCCFYCFYPVSMLSGNKGVESIFADRVCAGKFRVSGFALLFWYFVCVCANVVALGTVCTRFSPLPFQNCLALSIYQY